MSDQDAARAIVERMPDGIGPDEVSATRGWLIQEIGAALRAEREAGGQEMRAAFMKHHDACHDFRHCECASGFWYEFIGKPWMEEKQAQEETP